MNNPDIFRKTIECLSYKKSSGSFSFFFPEVHKQLSLFLVTINEFWTINKSDDDGTIGSKQKSDRGAVCVEDTSKMTRFFLRREPDRIRTRVIY
jgi:hypothetical protein